MPASLDLPDLEQETSIKQGLCPNWHVIFLNDDYHSFQFVIHVIMSIFRKEFEEAFVLTKQIHEKGLAIVTTCTKERAELYLEQVSSMKEEEKGAISCKMEPAD